MSGNSRGFDIALGAVAPVAVLIGFLITHIVAGGHDLIGCYRDSPRAVSTIQSSNGRQVDCRDVRAQTDDKCQAWRQAEAGERQACIAYAQFVIGSLISLLGLGGLILTVRYTAASAQAASEAAQQAAKAVDVQMQAEGAFFYITRVERDPIWPDGVIVHFINAGKTPAYVICWFGEIKIRRMQDLEASPVYDDPTFEADTIVEAGHQFELRFRGTDANFARLFTENDLVAHAWGYITFMDVFGKVTQLGFGRWTKSSALANALLGDRPHRLVWNPITIEGYNHTRNVTDDHVGT